MDNPTSKDLGIIKNINTTMKISQARWDVIFHKNKDCDGAKRPTGCLVCEHDTENCSIPNCALCQKKKGLPFIPGVEYVYPDK
jgi:hypothetical protein